MRSHQAQSMDMTPLSGCGACALNHLPVGKTEKRGVRWGGSSGMGSCQGPRKLQGVKEAWTSEKPGGPASASSLPQGRRCPRLCV